MPEIINQPDGDWVDCEIVYDTPNFDQVAESLKVDGAENKHSASLWQHGNCSIVYYRKTSPGGTVLLKKNLVTLGTPHVIDPNILGGNIPKTVDFDMTPDGNDVAFQLGGHTLSHLHNYIALGRVEGVWVPLVSTPPAPPREGPCGPLALPYFRPGNSLTRGQVSKIIVEALEALGLQFPAYDPNAQVFEDVPVGSTFHEYASKLAATGAISGYACTPQP